MITYEIETITPEIALEILTKKNTKNRPENKMQAKIIANEIVQNKWDINGETIKFSTGGLLLDGQTRLRACIFASKPIKTIVVRGLNKKVFDSIDAGRKRTGADALSVLGEKNTKILDPAIKSAYSTINNLAQNRGGGSVNEHNITTQLVIDLLPKYKGIQDSVKLIVHHKRDLNGIIALGYISALHYIIRNHAKADEFVEKLATGANLDKHNPILLYRNIIVNSKLSGNELNRFEKIALLIKVWNLYANGEEDKKLITPNRMLDLKQSKYPKFESIVGAEK